VFDYLVVGAGFSGAVVASQMARRFNKRVMLVDRRSHVGGNAFDHRDDAGIMVHKYGPHIFHTQSKDVFDYLSQFTQWRNYEHRVLASVDGKLVPIPINLDTVNILHGLNLKVDELEGYLESIAEKRPIIRTSEDVVVSRVGRDFYEKMFRGYTRKQWGLDPSELDSSVTARIPVRLNRDDRYFSDMYQAMPLQGFTRMFENMLDHPNIKIVLNTDYRDVLDSVRYRELVYTGPVDEFFDYRFGRLPYRSLKFRHQTLNQERLQPVAVINYPNDHEYTRVTEFKHLTGQAHAKTSVVYEYPCDGGDPYYPIPRAENAALYKQYEALAARNPEIHFSGRLATYKYYNMDQVVAQALTLCSKLSATSRDYVMGKQPSSEKAALQPVITLATS
jgi:UDP-galactopyranose mutase